MKNCWSVSTSIAAEAKTGYRRTTANAPTPICRRRNRRSLILSTATVNPLPAKERYAEILAKRDYYLQAPKQDFPC